MLTPKNFAKSYVILLSVIIYMYWFESLDRMAIQYFLLSVLNVVSIILIPFVFKQIEIKEILLNPLAIAFTGYLIFAFLSMIVSVNVLVSLERLGQLIAFFLTLLIFLLLLKEELLSLNFILSIISISLIVDIGFSLRGYVETLILGLDWSYLYINDILGLFGNRNIISSSILFRIPLLILLAIRLNRNNFFIITFIIISIAFFDLMLLSSRAAYLGIIVCLIFGLSLLLYKKYKTKHSILKYLRVFVFLYIIPAIIAYYIANDLIDTNDVGNINDRVSSIVSQNDESKNTRLRYYSQAIKHIGQNPLLGTGIGNWKILSIKYDKEYIRNYVIPYNAHNDILEATAETGIPGGVFFTAFFVILFYYLLKEFKIKSDNLYDFNCFLLSMFAFLIYMIDLNLNFPSSRPFNLYFLLLLISIVYISNSRVNEKQ
jgi:O-antigen ligase